jgi:hypothetical protein
MVILRVECDFVWKGARGDDDTERPALGWVTRVTVTAGPDRTVSAVVKPKPLIGAVPVGGAGLRWTRSTVWAGWGGGGAGRDRGRVAYR